MLAQLGCSTFGVAWRFAESRNRRARIIGDCILKITYGRDATIFFAEPFEPVLRRGFEELTRESGFQFELPRLRRELVGDQVLATQFAAKILPEFRFQSADRDVGV